MQFWLKIMKNMPSRDPNKMCYNLTVNGICHFLQLNDIGGWGVQYFFVKNIGKFYADDFLAMLLKF